LALWLYTDRQLERLSHCHHRIEGWIGRWGTEQSAHRFRPHTDPAGELGLGDSPLLSRRIQASNDLIDGIDPRPSFCVGSGKVGIAQAIL
jgi:hypothetical protein